VRGRAMFTMISGRPLLDRLATAAAAV